MTKAELVAKNEHLKQRLAEWEASLKETPAQLEAYSRTGKRQAASFSRGPRKPSPSDRDAKKGTRQLTEPHRSK